MEKPRVFDSFEEMCDFLQKERYSSPWYEKVFHRWSWKIRNRWSVTVNLYERARYGYGHRDLWSFDTYIAGVIGRASLELSKKVHGWPLGDEFPTYESWVEFLEELGRDLTDYESEGFETEDPDERARAAMERFSGVWVNMWD